MEPVNRAFNVAVLQCAARLHPTGFGVLDNAPDSLDAINAYVARHKRFAVWSGASTQTIFACEETNYAFRAWHDWHHWKLQAPFSAEGEHEVFKAQWRDLVQLYGPTPFIYRPGSRNAGFYALPLMRAFYALLNAEIMGQLAHQERHGDFPTDQRGFVLAVCTRGLWHALQWKW